MSDIWEDPSVKAALRERSADDIAVLECPKCGRWGYYNQERNFYCRTCRRSFYCCPEGEQAPLDRAFIRLDSFTTLADITEIQAGGAE
jgi:hypothetical protein